MASPRPRPVPPGPGQESVWDYPRPPLLESSTRHLTVHLGDQVVADTRGAYRVLETSHPPTWYLPRADVIESALRPSRTRSTMCEWKGAATYWDVIGPVGAVLEAAAWSYERPTAPFREITGYLAFAADDLDCRIDEVRVRPQEGFYAGWITDEVVGPFKGGPGTWGW